MRQDDRSSFAVVDYAVATGRLPPPRRVWIPIALAVLIWIADALVPRLDRWPWPLPGDYGAMAVALAGIVVCALLTSAAGWLLGVCGVACALAFFVNMTKHRQFYLGIGEPVVFRRYLYGWGCGFIAAWLVGRFSVVLRRLRVAA